MSNTSVQDYQPLSDTGVTFDETMLAFCEELAFNHMIHDIWFLMIDFIVLQMTDIRLTGL